MEEAMVEERRRPFMKGGFSVERIFVGEAVMVVTWYAKEQILLEIMGHHKQITRQPMHGNCQ
jgi:hypothetical protein